MSFTVFYALCILSVDFLIYFFFKLTYSEKVRVRRRHLPRDYYSGARSSSGTKQKLKVRYAKPAYRLPRPARGCAIPGVSGGTDARLGEGPRQP